MTKDDYTPIKLPNDIIKLLDKVIKKDELNFKNRPDLVKYLIRKYIDDQNKSE